MLDCRPRKFLAHQSAQTVDIRRLHVGGVGQWAQWYLESNGLRHAELYRVTFLKKLYRRIEELQADLDAWLIESNEQRPHQGRWCYGKTPIDTLPVAKEKLMQVLPEASKHRAA